MSCSTDDAYKAVKNKPALSLAVLSTPAGALGFFFILLTSVEGVRSFTESSDVLDLLKKSLTSVFSLFKSLGERNLEESRGAIKMDSTATLVFALTSILVGALLIAFANDSVSWLSAIMGVLVGFIILAIISRSLQTKWVKAVNGGAIVGASVALFYWLIKQIDTWSTKYVFTDVVFFSLFVYIVLAGLALWNIYIYQPLTSVSGFINV